MADDMSSGTEQSIKRLDKKVNYINWWLFRAKGTVAEPWPTAEQLLKDPYVQQAISNHNRNVFTHLNKKILKNK